MSSTALTFAAKEITIYVGIPIFVFGTLGGIFNIAVFLSLKTFRQSSCAFFLTIMSFVNIGQLLTGLLGRIMISGFDVDWTETSLSYCKFRNSCLQVCALTSYTCLCLATVDQFMATSLHIRWQQYFNIKKAYVLSAMALIIWIIHGIPTAVWFNLSFSVRTGKTGCVFSNSNFQQYYTYVYVLILAGILPIIFNILFGSLAYRNVRQIPYRAVPLVRRELDKQLTTMVLTQVVYQFFVVGPYVTQLFLLNTLNITSTQFDIAALNFGSLLTGIIYYLHFASPFYIYMCVSKRFRQQFIYVIFGIYFNRQKQENFGNQVSPENEQQQQQ